jgi:feruloyl esterase
VLKPSADSLINMELWLPPADKWNGKFMGVGNGGFAGSIQGLTNEMPQALRLGYATAGTDTGHQEQGGAWAIGHPEKMIDFGYRATHEMTLKSKQIVKAFYDQSPKYSYFKGCSTGGRMALMEAQRYPDDYDGIIAGSLANRHIHMWTAGVARSIDLSRHPEKAITAEHAALVNNLVNTCDTLKEGFLNNPRACKVDFSSLRCKAGQTPDNSCLTAPQMETVGAGAPSGGGGGFGGPRPGGGSAGAFGQVGAGRGGGRRYGFNCGYCSSRLEATATAARTSIPPATAPVPSRGRVRSSARARKMRRPRASASGVATSEARALR